MRSRGVVVVLLVAAAVALISGCGSSSSSSSTSNAPGKVVVTLQLLGGTEGLNSTACGKQEAFDHYAYSAQAQVRYSGSVLPAPAGRWKVKVKLKICNGGSFVDVSSQKIVGQTSGRFDGIFPVSKPGYYSLRAELQGSTPKPESFKSYLKVG